MYTGFTGMCIISTILLKQNYHLMGRIEEIMDYWNQTIEIAEQQQKTINEIKKHIEEAIS